MTERQRERHEREMMNERENTLESLTVTQNTFQSQGSLSQPLAVLSTPYQGFLETSISRYAEGKPGSGGKEGKVLRGLQSRQHTEGIRQQRTKTLASFICANVTGMSIHTTRTRTHSSLSLTNRRTPARTDAHTSFLRERRV